MNEKPSSSSLPMPDVEGITQNIHQHSRKMRALAGAAFVVGFLAIAASILIAAGYFVLYRPKQLQLLRDVSSAAQAARSNAAASASPTGRQLDFPSVQATMTHVLSFGAMLIAVAVGLSAAGTLLSLVLVLVSRRATLHQINASLARLSTQLTDLQRSK